MLEINTIYNIDCLEGLKLLDDESVNLIVTSPPYWQLRDYGVEGQIGLEPTFNEYIEKLSNIFLESQRVLKKDGALWIVIGDTYSGTKIGKTDLKMQYITKQNITKRCKELPNKSLCNIPARFSIAMQENGWILRNEIIWHKPNAMPSSVTDRFTIDFEKIFFFVKSQKYYFNQPKEPMKTTDISSPRGSKGVLGNLNGGRRKQDNVERNDYIGFNNRYIPSENLTRNKRTVWSINTQQSHLEHYAMFPKEIVETIIESCSKPNDIVLDIFSGSGTTASVAKSLNRNYIGFDLKEEYCELSSKRLNETQLNIFGLSIAPQESAEGKENE